MVPFHILIVVAVLHSRLLSVIAVDDDGLIAKWMEFQRTFNRHYKSSVESSHRFDIFSNNLEFIRHHNKQNDLGLASFRVGINQFTDMTESEVVAQSTGLIQRNTTMMGIKFQPNTGTAPKEFNWQNEGAVTPVKNQQDCGSCWAFASVAALESHSIIKHKRSVILSEQQLVDCSHNGVNSGCEGGIMEDAYTYVKDNKGIDTESSYPYTALDGVCRSSVENVGATCSGHVFIESGKINTIIDNYIIL